MSKNEVKELEKTKDCEHRFFSGDCKYRCNAGTECLECLDADMQDCHYRQLQQQREENTYLREALNRIADNNPVNICWTLSEFYCENCKPCEHKNECGSCPQIIAKQALEGK